MLVGPPPPAPLLHLAHPAQQGARALLSDLEQEVLEPTGLARALQSLEEHLAALSTQSLEFAPRISQRPTPASQAITLSVTREREGDNVLETYQIYDDHFSIRRLQHMTWMELAAQSALVLRRTVGDLPRTLLGREQYRAMMAAIVDMLEQLYPLSNEPTTFGALAPVALSAFDSTVDRWQNGHHLFGLCCYFSREYLARAIVAAEAEDVEAVCQDITKAALHLLASSATMVYTTDFPASVYLGVIRPDMPEGFSGSHNSDFNHFKMWKGKLHVGLMKKWGDNPRAWPPQVTQAASYFRSIDLLDVEYHVMVAASRIGVGLSLKQLQSPSDDLNALEGLRHLAVARRHDFHL